MQESVRRMLVLGCILFLMMAARGYGQSGTPTDQSTPTPTAAPSEAKPEAKPSASAEGGGRIGVGVKVSMLGAGIEVATRVTHRTNIRAGFNMITYGRTFNKDGTAYDGQLQFKSVEAHYDIFPFAGGFRISPGVLAYIGDPITATAAVPGGQSFTLGGVQYYSDPTTPVMGTGKIDFNRAAPTITLGWGNLVPRKRSKHFSVPVEIGVAFQGSPKATLNLAGDVCTVAGTPPTNCGSIASNFGGIQTNVLAEQTKLNNSMSLFKEYPIISIGFGYKF